MSKNTTQVVDINEVMAGLKLVLAENEKLKKALSQAGKGSSAKQSKKESSKSVDFKALKKDREIPFKTGQCIPMKLQDLQGKNGRTSKVNMVDLDEKDFAWTVNKVVELRYHISCVFSCLQALAVPADSGRKWFRAVFNTPYIGKLPFAKSNVIMGIANKALVAFEASLKKGEQQVTAFRAANSSVSKSLADKS